MDDIFDKIEMLPVWEPDNWPKDRWPNFALREMNCQETGICRMNPETMDRLQQLRYKIGRPINLTSAYRDISHSIEVKKKSPGSHAQGRAVDIGCALADAYDILAIALSIGWTGIGVAQSGTKRFIHLDDLDITPNLSGKITRPTVWSY